MLLRPTHTDQKLDSFLFIDPKTGYALGRMPLRPTLTDQKLDGLLADDLQTRYVLEAYLTGTYRNAISIYWIRIYRILFLARI